MFSAPTEWKHQLPIIQATTCIIENKSSPLHHPATLISLAATRWKLQLPVFKHPLEPLRTTVLPSSSQPPLNIKIMNTQKISQINHFLPSFLRSVSLICSALHFLLLCYSALHSISLYTSTSFPTTHPLLYSTLLFHSFPH